jgi:hypothetical protein
MRTVPPSVPFPHRAYLALHTVEIGQLCSAIRDSPVEQLFDANDYARMLVEDAD